MMFQLRLYMFEQKLADSGRLNYYVRMIMGEARKFTSHAY
jgi:hypothetical protein